MKTMDEVIAFHRHVAALIADARALQDDLEARRVDLPPLPPLPVPRTGEQRHRLDWRRGR
jgi:hypothetical protein